MSQSMRRCRMCGEKFLMWSGGYSLCHNCNPRIARNHKHKTYTVVGVAVPFEELASDQAFFIGKMKGRRMDINCMLDFLEYGMLDQMVIQHDLTGRKYAIAEGVAKWIKEKGAEDEQEQA